MSGRGPDGVPGVYRAQATASSEGIGRVTGDCGGCFTTAAVDMVHQPARTVALLEALNTSRRESAASMAAERKSRRKIYSINKCYLTKTSCPVGLARFFVPRETLTGIRAWVFFLLRTDVE